VTFDELHREIQDALRGDLKRAGTLVRRFERDAQKRGRPLDRAMAIFERAQFDDVCGRTQAASDGYRRARRAFGRLYATRHAFAADLGMVAIEAQGGNRRAVRTTARRLRRTATDPILAAAAELAIGGATLQIGDLGEAESAFRSVLGHIPRSKKTPAPLFRAQARLNLAICLTRRGHVAAGLRAAAVAEGAFTRLGVTAEADAARHTHGWILGVSGDAEGALAALGEAEKAFTRGRDPIRAALVELDRSLVHTWMGDFRVAADEARTASRNLRRRGQSMDAARADLAAARADLAAGRTRRARAAAHRARETCRSSGDRAGAAIANVILGHNLARAERVLADRGYWLAAVEALLAHARSLPPRRGARRLEERLHNYPRVLTSWIRADLDQTRARVPGADRIPLLRRAARAAEDLRGRAPTTRLRATTLSSHLEIYVDLAAELLARNRPQDRREAFVMLDAVRARTLREEVGGLAGNALERPKVRALRERLESLWRVLEHDEALLSDIRLSRVEAIREVAACERALIRASRGSAPGPIRRRPTELPATPTLAFSVLHDRLVGTLAADGDVWAWDCGPIRALLHELERFHFQITRRLFGTEDVAAADRSLAELSRRLLDNAPPLDERRLVVVLPPVLGAIPVEALPYDGAPLGEKCVIVHSPCACGSPRVERADGPSLVVGIGGHDLPEVAHETAFVARRIGAATVLEGESADRQSVLNALPGKRLIHVAAHARAREDVPPLSALRVHNGWLAAADLRGGLEGAIVVLSGCRTGDPGLRWHDEGMAGFPRALLAAGASTVVASRWEMADDIAHRWMRAFYDVPRNTPTADAVAIAGRRMRRRYPHPADWCAFLAIRGVT